MNATVAPTRTAPVKATWICLIIAWVLFLIPLPGAGLFVGWPLNLVAFILAIVVMTRGKTAGGLIPLLASIIVSPIVYFVGLAVLGAAVGLVPHFSSSHSRGLADCCVCLHNRAVCKPFA